MLIIRLLMKQNKWAPIFIYFNIYLFKFQMFYYLIHGKNFPHIMYYYIFSQCSWFRNLITYSLTRTNGSKYYQHSYHCSHEPGKGIWINNNQYFLAYQMHWLRIAKKEAVKIKGFKTINLLRICARYFVHYCPIRWCKVI